MLESGLLDILFNVQLEPTEEKVTRNFHINEVDTRPFLFG